MKNLNLLFSIVKNNKLLKTQDTKLLKEEEKAVSSLR